jgi:hypothetical protein
MEKNSYPGLECVPNSELLGRKKKNRKKKDRKRKNEHKKETLFGRTEVPKGGGDDTWFVKKCSWECLSAK